VTATEAFRVDMHVKVLDERVVRRAKDRDLDAIVYAPHFTPLPEIERRAAAFTDPELLVVPAREVFTGGWCDRKHLLAVGLGKPVPDFLTLEGALLECRDQNAVTLVPHPGFLTVSLDRADVGRYRALLDGVETYNPKFLPHHDRRASSIAEDASLPAFGSSYAHLRGSVGEGWTAFDRAAVEPDAPLARGPDIQSARSDGGHSAESGSPEDRSARDRPEDAGAGTGTGTETEGWLVDRTWSVRVAAFVEALGAGVSRAVSHRSGLAHRARCVEEFAHLGYENSLTKAIRVLRSRLPGTHPGRPLYGSRFDDIRVY
jgi:predicted metal-dependent phosphoesterase TrpH